MNKPSKIKIDFKKDGHEYSAIFAVTAEPNGVTYHLHAEVKDARGKTIFQKERSELDYIQVEQALIFVFHQAFVSEEV